MSYPGDVLVYHPILAPNCQLTGIIFKAVQMCRDIFGCCIIGVC